MIPWKRSSKSNICFMTNLLLGVLTECDAWETGWENPEQRQLLTGLASSVRDICWKGDNLKLPRYTSSDFLCWSSFKRTKPHHSWTGARAAWAAGAASALFPAEAALPPCRGGESLFSREKSEQLDPDLDVKGKQHGLPQLGLRHLGTKC